MLRAIRHWETRTCLTFIPKRPRDRNYVSFYKGSCGSVINLSASIKIWCGNFCGIF